MRLKSLLLLILLPLAAIAADPPGTEYYTATTTGELTIDAQGRVADVEIDYRRLGKPAMDAIVEAVRRWEFEPVVENGQPVAVRGRMELSLLAVHAPGQDGLDVAIRRVTFLDPPGTPPGAGTPKVVGALAPPRYPQSSAEAGVGGLVMLVLRLAADGSVAEVGSEQVLLFGDVSANADVQKAHVRRFVAAATGAAAAWRFSGNGLVRVPVQFNAPGFTNERWSRTRAYALAPLPWLGDALAAQDAPEIDPAGRVVDTRLQLRTPLADRIGGG